jgi:hypothetical protein
MRPLALALVVAAGCAAVRPPPPRLEDVIATLQRSQLDQLAELKIDATPFQNPPPRGDGTGRRVVHTVVAVERSADGMHIVLRTDVIALRWGMLCAGVESPMQLLDAGGVALTRGYHVERTGRITRAETPPPVQFGVPSCPPNLP